MKFCPRCLIFIEFTAKKQLRELNFKPELINDNEEMCGDCFEVMVELKKEEAKIL